jgi:hypothetical protein
MFRTFRRKWWKFYLTVARAWAKLTTWRHLEQRAWFGKPSTKSLMLSLGLVGATLYTANAFYVPASKCGSGVAEAATKHSVTEDVQQTGSVDQSPRLKCPSFGLGHPSHRPSHLAGRMDLRELSRSKGESPKSSRIAAKAYPIRTRDRRDFRAAAAKVVGNT